MYKYPTQKLYTRGDLTPNFYKVSIVHILHTENRSKQNTNISVM